MTSRATWITVCGSVAALAAAPAIGQAIQFQILQPASTLSTRGRHVIEWQDRGPIVAEPPTAITWYSATRPDGEDRRRIVTLYQETLGEGFRANWQPEGLFDLGWMVKRDRDRRSVLSNRDPAAGSCFLRNPPVGEDNLVLSVLARPNTLNASFSVGLRSRPRLPGYEIRTSLNTVTLQRAGEPLASWRCFGVRPLEWYWYELGVRTIRKREVEIRVRILDERQERCVAGIPPLTDRPPTREHLTGGTVSLTGPAEFAEVYLDPWHSRWTDARLDRVEWNTTGIPDGHYYLMATLCDGRKPPRTVTSDFQVEVRNSERANIP
jgi:hypothetical protein